MNTNESKTVLAAAVGLLLAACGQPPADRGTEPAAQASADG